MDRHGEVSNGIRPPTRSTTRSSLINREERVHCVLAATPIAVPDSHSLKKKVKSPPLQKKISIFKVGKKVLKLVEIGRRTLNQSLFRVSRVLQKENLLVVLLFLDLVRFPLERVSKDRRHGHAQYH